MKPTARFDNPMLTGLRGRRFARGGRTGRIETRPFGAGGVLREDRPANLHANRQVILNRFSMSPVFRIAINRSTGPLSRRDHDRVETHLIREPGVVRELLRFESDPSSAVTGSDALTWRSRSVRELSEATIERIVRQRRRIETSRDSSVVMRERVNLTADLERALKQSVTSPNEANVAQRIVNTAFPGPSPAPTLPDLDRLTDQIVSRIDDRLIAHRERMGGHL